MTEETNLKVQKFHELMEEINVKAKEITKSALLLNKKLHEIIAGEGQFPRELSFLFKNHKRELGLLSIFSLLNEFENIDVSSSQGITVYYLPNRENPVHLYPNGIEQAKILLYSDSDHYEEDPSDRKIVTQEELIKRFPELKEKYDVNTR